jgi:hypothetical protein
MKLSRFWIRFKRVEPFSPLNIGCGVTAMDREDAENLLRELVFANDTVPAITECIEDVDISQLDSHVISNMASPLVRGVWFPLGYSN